MGCDADDDRNCSAGKEEVYIPLAPRAVKAGMSMEDIDSLSIMHLFILHETI